MEPTAARAAEETDNAVITEIARAIQCITQADNVTKEKLDCLETLHTVLDNIITSPSEAKFRTLRTSNTLFQSKIAKVSSGVDFLRNMGFKTKVVEFREHMVLAVCAT